MDQKNNENQAAQVPAAALLGMKMFREALEEHLPKLAELTKEEIGGATLGDLKELCGATEEQMTAALAALGETAARLQKITEEEARSFDPDVDLSDDHYLWGTPENKERCVASIERRYAGRTGGIVFYGPSNITLWYSLEKDMLPYKAQNHGMGGCTDVDLMHYADRLLYPYAPKVVFFQTGSNDLAEGMTPEQILENKKKMYGMFLEKLLQTELVVMSGLPLPGRQQFWPDTDRTNQFLKEMCESHPRLHFMDATDVMLAAEGEADCVTPDGRYFRRDYFRMDQIHLNVAGHNTWTALMKDMLSQLGVTP